MGLPRLQLRQASELLLLLLLVLQMRSQQKRLPLRLSRAPLPLWPSWRLRSAWLRPAG